MDWDWRSRPVYESERLRVDGTLSPVVFYDMKQPRLVEDHEIELMLSILELHIENQLPFVGLVRHERGTGVIAARHRRTFANWLDSRQDLLTPDLFSVVVVVPESIYRAVLRVVYRFRAPPLRTVTTPDLAGAAEAVRAELERIGRHINPEIETFLAALTV